MLGEHAEGDQLTDRATQVAGRDLAQTIQLLVGGIVQVVAGGEGPEATPLVDVATKL